MTDTQVAPDSDGDPGARLMLDVQRSNMAAFDELVESYQGQVFTQLYASGLNRALAEDRAQEVFLRAYRTRRSYVPRITFSEWLQDIVQKVAGQNY